LDKNSYLIDLSESDRTDFGHVDFAVQSYEQRVFSAIWALESQVNNGGFVGFFDNEDPLIVSFAASALQAIGATRCAEIVDRAVALASSLEPGHAAEELDSLDSAFYEYPDNLTELLYQYVAVNQETFGRLSSGV